MKKTVRPGPVKSTGFPFPVEAGDIFGGDDPGPAEKTHSVASRKEKPAEGAGFSIS